MIWMLLTPAAKRIWPFLVDQKSTAIGLWCRSEATWRWSYSINNTRFVTFCHLQWYHEKIYGVVGFKLSEELNNGEMTHKLALCSFFFNCNSGYSQPSGSTCSIHLPALTAAQWISKTCLHHPVISSRPPRQTSDSKNWPGNTAASTAEMVQVLALKEVTTISVNLAMKRTHIRKCCINES